MGANSYKTTCPRCGGHNFYVTTKNGLGYCFNCSYYQRLSATYPVQTSPKLLREIREFYTEIAHYYHSCLDTRCIQWLHQRGITDEMIDRFMIGYVPASNHVLYTTSIAELAGIAVQKRPFLADRIVFPYFRAGLVYDLRGRSLRNEERKYLSPRHSSSLRGATIAYNADVLEQKHDTVVVTEGEIKAIASCQAGIQAVAFPGIRSYRDLFFSSTQNVVICFDNQVRNHHHVYQAIIDIANTILSFTRNVFVALLPLAGGSSWFGYEKMDIDQYILLSGASAYRDVIANAIPYLKFLRIAGREM